MATKRGDKRKNAPDASERAPKKPRQKTKRELEEENEKLRSENAGLIMIVQQQGQQLAQSTTKRFVFNTSSAAKNEEDVDSFHEKFLCKKEWRGSFVAYNYYIEVVKGARRMTCDPQEDAATGSGPSYITEAEWEPALEAINTEAHQLLVSFQKSTGYQDAENPQSDILAKLMESAFCLLAGDKPHYLRVTHQYGFNVSVKEEELKKSIRKSSTEEDDTAKLKKKTAKRKKKTAKLEFVPDVVVWMMSTKEGRNWLASFEFKPSSEKPDQRQVQAEMNAFNIITHRNRPCIAVDVSGSRNFEDWVFRASAIVPNPVPTMSTEHQADYVKSCFLEETKGAEGVLRLAAGLLRGKSFFNDRKLTVLGPTVAVVPPRKDNAIQEKRVVKAYDRSTSCQPNIDLVRTLVDPGALIWTSSDSKLQLVETLHFESDWTKVVPCSSFIAILGQLKALHDKDSVHGDVRLGNMLSCGKLIDLDYVLLQEYPSGLKQIPDGERHPSVKESIDDESIGDLRPDKKHDLYSMGAVMGLFRPSDSGHESVWLEASHILINTGDDAMAVALTKLGELDGAFVELTDENKKKIFNAGLTVGNPQVLLGTGGTPEAPKTSE
jgi:hypothetical protein